MPVSNAGVDRVPGHLAADLNSIHEEEINGTQVYRGVAYQTMEMVGPQDTFEGVVRDQIVTDLGREHDFHERNSILEEEINGTQVYRAAAYQTHEAIADLAGGIQSSLPNMVLAAPSISSIDPTSGLEAGGYSFTILGANFTAGATVTFGANPATGLTILSGQITGTVPAGTVGAVTVTVTNTDAQFTTTSFTYTAAPVPPVPALDIEPDLGGVSTRFTSSLNLSIPIADLVPVGGSEGQAKIKGVSFMRVTLNGTVYEVPIAFRKQIRGKNGGRVFWQSTTTGDSGSFKFYYQAPPVFLEEDE